MSGYPDDGYDRDDRDDGLDRRDDARDVRAAKGIVTAPAIGLIVVAALMLVSVVFNLVQAGGVDKEFDAQVKEIENNNQFTDDQKKDQIQFLSQIRDWVKILLLPYLAVYTVCAIVILVGGIKLMNLSSPVLVYLSAVLVMFPCSLCCFLGLIFGIWTLVVMGKPEVKDGFAARRRTSYSPDAN